MAIFIPLVLFLFACVIYLLCRKVKNGVCKSRKRLDGKTCLVTGGTSGIGLEISIDLARRGARVIVVCPFQAEGTNAVKRIIEESENSNIVFKLLDLADFHAVKHFAKDILESEERLDILMNNAGISGSNDIASKSSLKQATVMRVNYLGHFLLTVLLLPILRKSGTPSSPSRIVNTVSIIYWIANIDVENLAIARNSTYGKFLIYANSKLCLGLLSRELLKRFPTSNIVINNADPGEVGTGIFFSCGFVWFMYVGYMLCYLFAKSPFEGAQTPLHVALDTAAGQSSGQVYRDCRRCKTPSALEDAELATKVWDKSVELVMLTDEEIKMVDSK